MHFLDNILFSLYYDFIIMFIYVIMFMYICTVRGFWLILFFLEKFMMKRGKAKTLNPHNSAVYIKGCTLLLDQIQLFCDV